MNDTYIVTSYVVIDDVLKAWEFQDDCRAVGSSAEILTVAVIAVLDTELILSQFQAFGFVTCKNKPINRVKQRYHKLLT